MYSCEFGMFVSWCTKYAVILVGVYFNQSKLEPRAAAATYPQRNHPILLPIVKTIGLSGEIRAKRDARPYENRSASLIHAVR